MQWHVFPANRPLCSNSRALWTTAWVPGTRPPHPCVKVGIGFLSMLHKVFNISAFCMTSAFFICGFWDPDWKGVLSPQIRVGEVHSSPSLSAWHLVPLKKSVGQNFFFFTHRWLHSSSRVLIQKLLGNSSRICISKISVLMGILK